ncbi:MAG: AAA family ATPase, partial [Saprospiraceae bacterium]|nr:AAA family ATPase [Saprospiraceae bacterium]
RAGTGKTALVATLGPDVEIIATDSNMRTLLNLKDKFYEERLKAEITPCYDDTPTSAGGFTKAKNRIIQISNEIAQSKYNRKVLAIDSLTTLAEGAMKYVLTSTGKWGIKAPTQPEWGQGITYVEQLINILRGLPIPVIVIAELLGVPAADAPHLLDWSHRLVAMYQFRRSRAIEDEAAKRRGGRDHGALRRGGGPLPPEHEARAPGRA